MTTLGNVLITGGASGLGAATARAVAVAGGRPLIIDRDVPHLDCPHVQADVADADQVERAVAELAAQADDRIDAVFTAAGTDACGPLATVPRADWERVLAVNLSGTVSTVRAALPWLERSGGRVITCSSTLGVRVAADATAYCASKFGVVGFTRALAAETAGWIKVTLLIPGGMHTAFFDGRPAQYQPPADAKLNRPEDTAAAVLTVLTAPEGSQIRELVVCADEEGSWP